MKWAAIARLKNKKKYENNVFMILTWKHQYRCMYYNSKFLMYTQYSRWVWKIRIKIRTFDLAEAAQFPDCFQYCNCREYTGWFRLFHGHWNLDFFFFFTRWNFWRCFVVTTLQINQKKKIVVVFFYKF